MATDTSYYDMREAETRMRAAAILQEAAELQREAALTDLETSKEFLRQARSTAATQIVVAAEVKPKREFSIEELTGMLEKFDRETTEVLMAHGEKIQAIKHIRQRTSASLYSAKRYVESFKVQYSCHTLDTPKSGGHWGN